MASNKVTLRTSHEGSVFVLGDVVVTHEGTEFPSKAKADEAIEAARLAGTALFEVSADEATKEPSKTEGGNG
jgi:NADH dehydrogenase FAD-containing subunit